MHLQVMTAKNCLYTGDNLNIFRNISHVFLSKKGIQKLTKQFY